MDERINVVVGISKLDWFAGMALQGLLANQRACNVWDTQGAKMFELYASSAYQFAAALLAESERRKEQDHA